MLKIIAVLAGLLVVACFVGWKLYDRQADLSARVERMKNAIEASDRLVKLAHDAERKTLTQLSEMENASDKRSKDLQGALARTENSLRACRISGDTLRVLNRSGVSGAASDAASDRPKPDALEAGAGSTCLAVIETFDANHRLYDGVVIQLNECRAFYQRTRAEYCKLTGAC